MLYINSMDEKKYKIYFDNLYNSIDDTIFLDEEQRKVIVNDDDNLLVIAGAGSGKTTTVASKVRFLVDKKDVKPSEILVISYTNKAVLELKERINNDFKINTEIYTFHKLAYRLLKKENNNYKILSDTFEVIKTIIQNNINKEFIVMHRMLRKSKNYKLKEDKIDDKIKYTYLTMMCMEIIKIIKNSNINFDQLVIKTKREIAFYSYLKKIYTEYNEYLETNNLLDFEDIINKCLQINISTNYKYIIVDEYQDISVQRYLLVKKIASSSNSKLMVVGDDWQSIFAFAGSKLELFTNISKDTAILKINNTYRNSQELIDIAGNFIMKNPKQVKKQLKSDKRICKPIVIVNYFYSKVFKLIEVINSLIKDYGFDKNILLLGRYNFDIDFIKKSSLFIIKGDSIIYKKYPKLKIVFLTVHSAKGLGFDNVIILNGNGSDFGFPSTIENDKIKDIVMGNNKELINEEERRLFYVALTRTKNKVYILAHKNDQSAFVKELDIFMHKKT